jgi:tRNA(Ile2) C34 agmatinyltransferase TiaS
MKKKQISKKKAATGRLPICGKCYVAMKQHADWTEGGWDWICERCGRRERGRSEVDEMDVAT